jgi:hypothetical protein
MFAMLVHLTRCYTFYFVSLNSNHFSCQETKRNCVWDREREKKEVERWGRLINKDYALAGRLGFGSQCRPCPDRPLPRSKTAAVWGQPLNRCTQTQGQHRHSKTHKTLNLTHMSLVHPLFMPAGPATRRCIGKPRRPRTDPVDSTRSGLYEGEHAWVHIHLI